jgi:hypothetical protein
VKKDDQNEEFEKLEAKGEMSAGEFENKIKDNDKEIDRQASEVVETKTKEEVVEEKTKEENVEEKTKEENVEQKT